MSTSRYGFLLRGAALLLVFAGCGSGENADELGNGDNAISDAGSDVPRDQGSLKSNLVPTVVDASATIEDLHDAVGTLDAPAADQPGRDADAANRGDDRDADVMDSAPPPDSGADGVPAESGGGIEASPSDAAGDCGDICGTIGIGIGGCPEIGAYSISPFTVAVGNPVNLTSMAINVNGATLSFHWTATQGSFVDPNAASTTYTCSSPGKATLTLTLTVPGASCSDAIDQDVHCL